ncbi:MAG TPA: prolyl oligopeptidase family serine peptidase [Myxococcales bacterium]|nr:prolyl oligopeptidase family serine peptidase [Myxococcales bacterium]
MQSRHALLAAAALLASCKHVETGSSAAPSGIAVFSRDPQFISVKVSPKGTYLAALSEESGQRSLSFIEQASHKIIYTLRPEGQTTLGRFFWANDERVVIQGIDREGYLARPLNRGEIFAVDANGTNGRIIFGYRGGSQQVGSHLRKAEGERAWGFVISTLRNDPRHVLIEQTAWDDARDEGADIYKLDVYSGLKTRVAHSPMPGASFLTDENGELRIAIASDKDVRARFFYFLGEEGWRELQSIRGVTKRSWPFGFVSKDRTLYVSEPVSDGFALYAVSIDTGERKLIAQNPSVPFSDSITDSATGRIIALEYEPDLPNYEFVDPKHPLSRALQGLLAARPNENVEFLNTTDDDGKVLVRAYSDRNPGEFLLMNVATMTAETIAQARPWVKPDSMAEMSAFHIAASDGFRIHGYVTLPSAKTEGPPPMIVLPHGGPHQVRDSWGFDSEAQLLAHEGFAVLQVNYRGSAGYGDAYEEAGYRKWGSRMIEDIIDATRFAVRKGFADPGRICIYGASFGGYAAMQSAILAPDLFRCAVGYAGIYDLALMEKTGDISWSSLGRGYVRTAVGRDERLLDEMSPVRHADKIKARVFLIHGKQDNRAPIEHAERLRDALRAQGHDPEWLVESKEGHGFFDEGARERMYGQLIRFLKDNTAAPTAMPAAAH